MDEPVASSEEEDSEPEDPSMADNDDIVAPTTEAPAPKPTAELTIVQDPTAVDDLLELETLLQQPSSGLHMPARLVRRAHCTG